MPRKYNTRCWICNSTDLEPDDRGMRCRSCGATYNIIPKVEPASVIIENDPHSKGFSCYKPTLAHPSPHAARRVSKARINSQRTESQI